MDRLAKHLRDLVGCSLDDLSDAVLERMVQATPMDDVALLAVRISRRGTPEASEGVR